MPIKRVEVTAWLNNPVTQAVMKVVKEHCDSIQEEIKRGIIDGPPLDQQNVHIYSQLKGQYLAFSEILEPKEFLISEFDQEQSEEINNEILTIESESNR